MTNNFRILHRNYTNPVNILAIFNPFSEISTTTTERLSPYVGDNTKLIGIVAVVTVSCICLLMISCFFCPICPVNKWWTKRTNDILDRIESQKCLRRNMTQLRHYNHQNDPTGRCRRNLISLIEFQARGIYPNFNDGNVLRPSVFLTRGPDMNSNNVYSYSPV